MIVLVIGVCGCGKTTIGQALAQELGWRFLDADDFHPEANVAKMASGGDVRVVYLKGDAATIEPRLLRRAGHFMPASLLPSQLATLEEPSDAIVVDIREPVAAQVAAITRALREQLPA